jgi:hypothetical protein
VATHHTNTPAKPSATAASSDANHSFKVTLQNGAIYYFPAQVMSFKRSVGSVDNIVAATINLEITSSSGGVGVVAGDALQQRRVAAIGLHVQQGGVKALQCHGQQTPQVRAQPAFVGGQGSGVHVQMVKQTDQISS